MADDDQPLLGRYTVKGQNPTQPNIGFVGQYKEDIEHLRRMRGWGRSDTTFTDIFRGLNHRDIPTAAPLNREGQGLVFFTRPSMCLSRTNLRMVRQLSTLLTSEPYSYQSAIRAYLDPDAANVNESNSLYHASPLVDPKLPFIPLLSYCLESMTGFPDPTLNYYTSPEGVHKEQWSMVDDKIEQYQAFDVNCTFKNIQGDPITLLIHTWLVYMSNVYNGTIMPYPKHIVENRIDYQSRVYRLILDPSKTYVQKIASITACFPYATSLGTYFNYNKSKVSIEESREISVPFRAVGVEYNDPILIAEFNRIVMMFNSDMISDRRNSRMVKLQQSEKMFFNFHGYPLINPRTMELEWFVDKDDYKEFEKWPEYRNNIFDPNNPRIERP